MMREETTGERAQPSRSIETLKMMQGVLSHEPVMNMKLGTDKMSKYE